LAIDKPDPRQLGSAEGLPKSIRLASNIDASKGQTLVGKKNWKNAVAVYRVLRSAKRSFLAFAQAIGTEIEIGTRALNS